MKEKLVRGFVEKSKVFKITTGVITFLLVSGLFAASIHMVDQKIAAESFIEVTLDSETENNYIEQIENLIQYENLEKMTVRNYKKKKDKVYVTVFDGYTDNIFVFEDDILVQYGSDFTDDLVNVKDE